MAGQTDCRHKYNVKDQALTLINNDLAEDDSAFCQPEETPLTEALAEVNSVFRGLTKSTVTWSDVIYFIEPNKQEKIQCK